MTYKKIQCYIVFHPDYEKITKHEYGTSYSNCEICHKIEVARKWARKMGDGAIIQQKSITRGGKPKIKEWDYHA